MRTKFFSGCLLSLLLLMQTSLLEAQPSHHLKIVVTSKEVAKIKSPEEFAIVFYSLLLANDGLNTKDNDFEVAPLFLSAELFNNFKRQKIADEKYMKATAEQGCINYDLLTDAQDMPRGFFIDEAAKQGKTASIPVALLYAEERNDSKPSVILELTKTTLGWKISDITYPHRQTSMRAEIKKCLSDKSYQ